MIFKKSTPLRGELAVPGDKSISHRAVMLGALAKGTTSVTNFLKGADCLSTISCFEKMGIEIEQLPSEILIHGKGLHGLNAPETILDAGNSGTTTRLLSGILAGQAFCTTLTGDASIQKRPMTRIITPLSQMGGKIESLSDNGCTAENNRASFKAHTLSFTGKLCTGEVLCFVGRNVCRWHHKSDRALSFPQPF